MINNAYQVYQNNSIYTAPPQELTLMLYNGAIKFCNQAIEMVQNKDIQNSNKNILRVQDIIVELQATLDMKYAISQQFDQMYEYIKNLLIEANISKDIEKIEEAKMFIVEFRDLWVEITKKHNKVGSLE